MKLVVPAFLIGTALGITGTWFALRSEDSSAKPAKVTASTPSEQAEVSRLRNLLASQKEEISALRDQVSSIAGNPATETKPEEKEQDLGGMMARMFEGGKLTKMMEAQAKGERRSKIERLGSRLKLTPEQRSSLEALLENQDKARIAQMEAFQKSPLMKKMFSGQELTEDEQKEIEKLQSLDKPASLKDWTRENLTPEQAANYQAYQQERRVAQAESSATQQLNNLTSVVDLTEEQKDKAFKHYSDQAMKAPLFDELEAMTGESLIVSGEAGESATVTSSVTIWHGDNSEEDKGLKNILTPEQFDTYKTHEEEKRKAQEEMMKSLGVPNFGRPKNDKKK